MSPADFLKLVGPGMGVGLGVAIVLALIGFLATRKLPEKERWGGALLALAMAGGFVAGFITWFGVPRKWDDEIWKWPVVAAGVAGVLMVLAQGLRAKIATLVLPVVVVAVTWITTRRIDDERASMMTLAVALAVYLAAFWPVIRDGKAWGAGLCVVLACAFPLAAFTFPADNNLGQMFMLLCALAGLAIVAGTVRPTRFMAGGAPVFLAVMFGVVVVLTAFYNSADYPAHVYRWFEVAPLPVGLAWIPGLRRRPWVCAISVAALTVILLIPALVTAGPLLIEAIEHAG